MARSGQLIIGLLNGVGDSTITKGVMGLQAKAEQKNVPSAYLFLNYGAILGGATMAAMEEIFVKFDEVNDVHKLHEKGGARLYIHGHGDWVNQSIAGFPAKLTYLLVQSLLEDTGAFSLISITACEAGRDKGGDDNNRVMHSADSFAWTFAEELYKTEGNRGIDVYARVYEVRINSFGTTVGKKQTIDYTYVENVPELPLANTVPKRARSKMRIAYKDGMQQRFWVDYDNKANPDAWPAID